FLEERFLTLCGPILRCRRDFEKSLAAFLQRSGWIAVGNGLATLELRHNDDIERLFRYGNEVVLLGEVGGFTHNFLRVTNDGIVVGMLLGQLVQDRDRHFLFVA